MTFSIDNLGGETTPLLENMFGKNPQDNKGKISQFINFNDNMYY